jgi:hypothetical protein
MATCKVLQARVFKKSKDLVSWSIINPMSESTHKITESTQVLKTRDDKSPVFFEVVSDAEDDEATFKLSPGSECSWHTEKDKPFAIKEVRPRIEPWLTALFQSEHLALLAGSGLTRAVHQLAEAGEATGMKPVEFVCFNSQLTAEAEKSAEQAGREKSNFEDRIRVANELLRGLDILGDEIKELLGKRKLLKDDLSKVLKDFADAILNDERNLMAAPPDKLSTAFNYLVSFLMSFASRTGTRDRLQVFTTNYDRYIEAGAELAGLHLLDRFVGSLAPIFRSSRLDIDMHYNPPGIRGEPRYVEGVARFTKLHGSVDWVNVEKNIRRFGLPFGAKAIKPYLQAPGLCGADACKLMIYPNAAKDRETAEHPYVELFRDFAAAVCRPNSTVVCYGYSFGDEHINRVLEDMLTIPSTHLVVISHSDPLGRIMNTYQKLGRHAQISLMLGTHLGDFEAIVDNYLPKPAIDKTTFRMAELLKARWAKGAGESKDDTHIAALEGPQK